MQFETQCLSSLTKVFPDEALVDNPVHYGSALWHETYAFQVAYRVTGPMLKNVQVEADSTLDHHIYLRSVGLVPSKFPMYHDHDANVLRTTPGLYPDPLYPIHQEGITVFSGQWRSIWVTVDVNDQITSGIHPIKIRFKSAANTILKEEIFELNIISAALPDQQLIHTEWLHADCLADQYDVPIFSERHWELLEQYVATAADHGINMMLTPIFTPPLDTDIGSERPTVQLVDVEKEGDTYHFSFDKLHRWIDLCLEKGIKYFEMAHLFTQWGAHHAPKIMATVNGAYKQIFGWETDAGGSDYQQFLAEFLPELIQVIKSRQLEHSVYFHVSDEPTAEDFESYKQASDIIHHHLKAFPVIDALSDDTFYEQGLVKNPIPANDHIEPFLQHNVPDLWIYYCCVQYQYVSNRFFSFPSARNRVIGMQLYKHGIKGFLHWGYNFWFTQQSRESINPFVNTDAGYALPSGDAFMVYPGADGPIESLRMEVFYEALQDMRALQLLENYIGKHQVIALMENDLEDPLTFKQYPHSSEWLRAKRETINRHIATQTKGAWS